MYMYYRYYMWAALHTRVRLEDLLRAPKRSNVSPSTLRGPSVMKFIKTISLVQQFMAVNAKRIFISLSSDKTT